MRITNKMMTNNMLSNISRNKVNMNSLEEQYSSGKKIQKPSDDPIVTVRALRLRSSLSELNQYYEKNIPDAKSWMDVTESSLTTVNDIMTQINTYCVQGSTDTLTVKDRDAVVSNLNQLKDQIYQEGNSNYAGRYVFTGYKTDSPLTFTQDMDNLSYKITENLAGSDIQILQNVSGSYEVSDFDNLGENFTDAPKINDTYRIQLSYDELSSSPPESIQYFVKNASGELEEQTASMNIISVSKADQDAYLPTPGNANYIAETGEIILASDVYSQLHNADEIKITYSKTGFKSGTLKPEHYFDCEMTDNDNLGQGTISFTKEAQKIQYEVNFNQKLTINTEGSDAITHKIGRQVDDILSAVDAVSITEDKISEVEKRLSDKTLSAEDVGRYTNLKNQLSTELSLKKEVMQKAFQKGMAVSTQEQDRVNNAVADLGSRYVRLELTENRLSSQQVDFTDLMSDNEDVDIVDTLIKYNSAEAIYNSSLSAASKVVQKSLLDFL